MHRFASFQRSIAVHRKLACGKRIAGNDSARINPLNPCDLLARARARTHLHENKRANGNPMRRTCVRSSDFGRITQLKINWPHTNTHSHARAHASYLSLELRAQQQPVLIPLDDDHDHDHDTNSACNLALAVTLNGQRCVAASLNTP